MKQYDPDTKITQMIQYQDQTYEYRWLWMIFEMNPEKYNCAIVFKRFQNWILFEMKEPPWYNSTTVPAIHFEFLKINDAISLNGSF